jgi:ribosome biogenesis GTPase
MNQSTNNIETRIEGVVISSTGSWYEVSTSRGVLNCRIRGKLRLKGIRSTNPVVVGDRVIVEPDEQSNAIVEIIPRRNYVIRRASNLSKESHIIAANIDRALLIVTLHSPYTAREFVDRFLVTCEAYNVPVTIILNKMDIYSPDALQMVEAFKGIYENAGYRVIESSAATGLGMEEIRECCKERIVLFSGQSGVGKSSLISALDPNLNLRVGEISAYHQQGKHTTTFYEMHPIASGGFVIDTPGIRGFGLVDVSELELSGYFPEMLRVEDNCRFAPCTHTHEPGCAVKEAVENGEISVERYESYLGMLDEQTKYR